MGFKGKKKDAPKPVAVKAPKQEYSSEEEDQEEVFSEEEEDDFQQEDDLLDHMPAEDGSDEEDEDEEEEDEDEDEGAEGQTVHWGKKSSFFQKDDDEQDDEDEDDELEETEAIRLLRKRQSELKQEFLQIGGDSDDEEDEPQTVPLKKQRKPSASRSAIELEDEAPEVDALLKEFAQKAKEIRLSVAPALQRLQSGEETESTKEGIAYLETKTHLLLSYITNVCFYLMFRAEHGGAQAESHPVVSQLVRLRVMLDKLRPLDGKLKNEVDELVRRAAMQLHREQEGEDGEDGQDEDSTANHLGDNGKKKKFEFRPDLNDLNDNENGDLPGAVEEDEEDSKAAKKSHKQLLRRAQKSQFVQELLREQLGEDVPDEIVSENKRLLSKEDEDRQRYEEANYMRLPENKKDRKRKAELHRKDATHGGLLSTLGEELEEEEYSKFRELMEDEGEDGDKPIKKKQGALSMHLNEMSQARKDMQKIHRGGDDDAEVKTKKKAGKEHTHVARQYDEVDGPPQYEEEREVASEDEHEFYKDTVKRRRIEHQAKEAQYEFPKRYAPEPVQLVEVGQARRATKEMIKNRGLTAHKNKDGKNPRSNLRNKYEAKVKARRGQVRDIRKGEADAYQGERTGIRTNLVRSRQAGKL
ncbi:hypothetical protein BASA81_007382 [Batrachochytrium salamandrivorans]|nr:hypothetical protein BASA81_007382 [Batrachochytrium salamandrivorans]